MTRRLLGLLAALALLLAACSSEPEAAPSTPATDPGAGTVAGTAPSGTAPGDNAPLRILVTNDDGVGAPGIDALVTALTDLPDVEVVVVAPAENQSGSSDSTTEVTPAGTPAATAGGYEATAVPGFPADAVTWALMSGELDPDFDLVISGVNEGQNIGPAIEISGTVGAARTGARAGIPALAVSAGFADEPDFAAATDLVVAWVEEHRAELVAGAPVTVVSLNVPSCPVGDVRGVVDVPPADSAEGRDILTVDCTSTLTGPADDIEAFTNGYASRSELAFAG